MAEPVTELLIKGTLDGDRDAEAALFERIRARLLRFVHAKLRQKPAATDTEDVVQTALLKIHVVLGKGEVRAQSQREFVGLLYKVCRNVMWDLHRAHKTDSAIDENNVLSPHTGPNTMAERKDQVGTLMLCLKELGPEDEQLVYLRDILGLPWKVISEQLDRPMATLSDQRDRAVARLGAMMRSRVSNQ